MKIRFIRNFWIVLFCVVLSHNSHCQTLGGDALLCGFQMVERVTVCEGGTLVLECESSSSSPKHIKIITADYGRTEPGSRVCPSPFITSTDCKSSNSTQIAKDRCNGKQICHLDASNLMFGEPCPATSKYLKVKFCCA